ncbi:Isoamylase 1, chloroplastic [Zea mays]|uniref:Isoamylase 1, chloroplastic n=1 Tax=Zea mays TaxID=4577 RepID=A0A3L6EH01_MAIZE|nr:Isoamylase 1, chloroplastic [Zea mays]
MTRLPGIKKAEGRPHTRPPIGHTRVHPTPTISQIVYRAVAMLVPLPPPPPPSRRNITANALAVLEAMAAHNVRTLIYSSTCATYGEPDKMPTLKELPSSVFPVNYFRWDKKEEQSSDLYRFCHLMTKFRKTVAIARHQPGKPDWSEASRFVAFTMKDKTKGKIYVAFNTSHLPVVVGLLERSGFRWEPVVDTGKEAPYDFLTDVLPDRAVTVYQFSHFLNSNLYPMLSYSSIILVLRPDV